MTRAFLGLAIPAITLALGVSAQARPDSSQGIGQPPPTPEQRAAAQRIWEQMIEAKGGRERLDQVENIVVEERLYLTFPPGRKFKNGEQHTVGVYVFPDRVWSWQDARSTVFGASASVSDVTKGIHYFVLPGDDIREGTDTKGAANALEYQQLIFLNETRWFKPVPVRVLSGGDIPRNMDAIEASVNGKRVDYWVNRKSHLPARIIKYEISPANHFFHYDRMYNVQYSLSNYHEIDGIRIPYRVSQMQDHSTGVSDRYIVRLNVKVRDDLFSKPPRFEDGPDAWKAP